MSVLIGNEVRRVPDLVKPCHGPAVSRRRRAQTRTEVWEGQREGAREDAPSEPEAMTQ